MHWNFLRELKQAGKRSFQHTKNCERGCDSGNLHNNQLGAHLWTEMWEHGGKAHRSWTCIGAPSVRQIKLPARRLPPFSKRWIKMYGERSRRFRVWLPSSSCWSDRVKDASDSPQTSGSPSEEQPVTHAVVTHHSWQRRRVRARHCGGNIITKSILGWHLPPPLWSKMGENKHSQPEKQ